MTIQLFDNGEFRLGIDPDGASFRVAAPGLARALGHREASNMLANVPDAEKGSFLDRTPGGYQRIWYVTEAGFYRVIGQRQAGRIKDPAIREQVTRFQNWVYREVLPSIRRTGGYAAGVQRLPTRAEALRELADLAERHEAQQRRLEAAEPKARSWDTLAGAEGDYSLRHAAFILDRDPAIETGQNRLMQTLRDLEMVDRQDIPYARHSRHLTERPRTYPDPRTGAERLSVQIRVTVEGLHYLHRKLGGTAPLRFTQVPLEEDGG